MEVYGGSIWWKYKCTGLRRSIHEVIYKALKHILKSLDKDQEGHILITGMNTDLWIYKFSIKPFYLDFFKPTLLLLLLFSFFLLESQFCSRVGTDLCIATNL